MICEFEFVGLFDVGEGEYQVLLEVCPCGQRPTSAAVHFEMEGSELSHGRICAQGPADDYFEEHDVQPDQVDNARERLKEECIDWLYSNQGLIQRERRRLDEWHMSEPIVSEALEEPFRALCAALPFLREWVVGVKGIYGGPDLGSHHSPGGMDGATYRGCYLSVDTREDDGDIIGPLIHEICEHVFSCCGRQNSHELSCVLTAILRRQFLASQEQ